MLNDIPSSSTPLPSDRKPASLRDCLLWLCPFIGLAGGIGILWLFGLTLWTASAFIFLVACPLIVVWVLLIERRQNRLQEKNHE